MHAHDTGWRVPVVTCSGRTGMGLEALWAEVEKHRAWGEASGALAERRKSQLLGWMWQMVEGELMRALRDHPDVRALLPELERDVHDGSTTATVAAQRILAAFGRTAGR
jgi:LAO/AO transport system kinase